MRSNVAMIWKLLCQELACLGCQEMSSQSTTWPGQNTAMPTETNEWNIALQYCVLRIVYWVVLSQLWRRPVFLHMTFASLTPCFKSTHPHQTVWTETISNPISIRTNVPRIPFPPPPPPFVSGRGIRGQFLRDSGRAGDLEYPGGAQGFSYKTCHVADREGFATWGNQGWVTWVSLVCPVVLSVSRQLNFKLYRRLNT